MAAADHFYFEQRAVRDFQRLEAIQKAGSYADATSKVRCRTLGEENPMPGFPRITLARKMEFEGAKVRKSGSQGPAGHSRRWPFTLERTPSVFGTLSLCALCDLLFKFIKVFAFINVRGTPFPGAAASGEIRLASNFALRLGASGVSTGFFRTVFPPPPRPA